MLQFNEHGYLVPDQPIELDFETFVREFVFNEHRASVLTEYVAMLEELSGFSLGSFYQWIDGSFTSRKARPNDMDVVSFIDFRQYSNLEPRLREMSRKYPKIDLYFVQDFPERHPRRFVTDFDKTEWLYLFSTDRRRLKKGFIQMNF